MTHPQSPFTIAPATAEQTDAILELFARLADFEIPERRAPEELWKGDAALLRQWAQGQLPEAIVLSALGPRNQVWGVAFAQPRAEALSGRPGAHLEVLAVAAQAEGRGVGSALMAATEAAAKQSGAQSLTLNVFMTNQRARGLYRKLGFDEEILRCIKEL